VARPLAIVTGANRGLGLATSRALAERGMRVLLAARREERGRSAAAALAGEGRKAFSWTLDVGDAASVDRFAERARAEGLRVDALVQNAGVYRERLDEDSARESMAVNALGPLRLADGLAPLLARGARVVMVSSGMGQLAELPADLRRAVEGAPGRAELAALADALVRRAERRGGGAYLAYAVSKAALNAATRLLAAELAPRGVLVNAVCPGWVRTDMGGGAAPRTVEEGVAGIVWAATLPPDGPSGGFFRDGRPIPW
jgi:NAD(P)-dependent dehydrogenase (short-subunit alcohol dehydrogenase family)